MIVDKPSFYVGVTITLLIAIIAVLSGVIYYRAHYEKKPLNMEQIPVMVKEMERACIKMKAKRLDGSLSDEAFYLWCTR